MVSLQVFKAANKLVRALLHSLVTCRPKEHRSVPPAQWNDAEWKKKHYESWGHVIDMAAADITWHTPSEEGLQLAADLAARYIKKPMQVLQRYATAMSSIQESCAPEPAAAQRVPETNGHPDPSVDSMAVDPVAGHSTDGAAHNAQNGVSSIRGCADQ